MTMILLIFGTLVLMAVGIQLNRTAERLNNYKILAQKQNILANVIETAGYLLMRSDSIVMSSTWDKIEEFKSKIASRAGIESHYWSDFLSNLTPDTPCVDMSGYINALNDDPAFGNGKYIFDVYVYEIGNKYLITATMREKESDENIDKCGVGFIADIVDVYLPAVRLAASNRVFSVMRNVGGGKGNPKIIGDLVYGKAIILDDVNLLLTDTSTPGEIITGPLTAKSVNIPDIEELYPGWFNHISDDPETIYQKWKSEYLSTLPAAEIQYVLDSDYTLSAVNSDETIVISAPAGVTDPVFTLFFDNSGLRIVYGTSAFIIPSSLVTDNTINIKINGDAVIGNDPHKISSVTGKYNIAIYGDVSINTNLVYDYLVDFVNNGQGNSPVGNKTKEVSLTVISDMLNSSWKDVLSLAAVGGDIRLLFGSSSSTQGNKTIMGNILALKNNGNGGDISFPDISEAIKGKGHTPQLFIFGALTSYTFDKDNQASDILSSLVAVAGYMDPSQTQEAFDSSRRMIGMMIW
ncbi:hypothetical protein [Kosmotoga pacifica]|uniref:hypothetical protein n=1 Tax=Kosmotoga pacifica TaxID=1330330 RepID=UPI000AD265E4|nr:hypothetical protein [Kosmotoga pacifica]